MKKQKYFTSYHLQKHDKRSEIRCRNIKWCKTITVVTASIAFLSSCSSDAEFDKFLNDLQKEFASPTESASAETTKYEPEKDPNALAGTYELIALSKVLGETYTNESLEQNVAIKYMKIERDEKRGCFINRDGSSSSFTISGNEITELESEFFLSEYINFRYTYEFSPETGRIILSNDLLGSYTYKKVYDDNISGSGYNWSNAYTELSGIYNLDTVKFTSGEIVLYDDFYSNSNLYKYRLKMTLYADGTGCLTSIDKDYEKTVFIDTAHKLSIGKEQVRYSYENGKLTLEMTNGETWWFKKVEESSTDVYDSPKPNDETITDSEPVLMIENGILIKYEGTEENVVIPNEVTDIGNYAFSYTTIKTVTIPASINTIGYGAFEGCDNMTDIYYLGSKKQWKKIYIDDDAINETVTINFSK